MLRDLAVTLADFAVSGGSEGPLTGYAVTLQDLARRLPAEPFRGPSGCPTCEWLDDLARTAFADPEGCDRSSLTDVRVLRRRHDESGECLAVAHVRA